MRVECVNAFKVNVTLSPRIHSLVDERYETDGHASDVSVRVIVGGNWGEKHTDIQCNVYVQMEPPSVQVVL
jgi:hypothetical protein